MKPLNDLLTDIHRLRELESELDAMRLRIASYQPTEFNRDGQMLEATIRIAGAASQAGAAATVLEWEIEREIGGE